MTILVGNAVYIRPLQIEDAQTSWQWRNNPKLWRWTGARPDRQVTPEIEKLWLEEVLGRKDERRFAICLNENNRYIGNIYLTDIRDKSAQIHIFIGDTEAWGGGRACEAIGLLLEYAFDELKLGNVQSTIARGNLSSIALSNRVGFQNTGEEGQYIKQIFTRDMFDLGVHREWESADKE